MSFHNYKQYKSGEEDLVKMSSGVTPLHCLLSSEIILGSSCGGQPIKLQS